MGFREPVAGGRPLSRGLGRRAAPVCVNGGLRGWKELTQPGDAPPLPRRLFTFAVLLAEPPVDALHHPGQLLLLQLPLLLPGLRGARGPLSARCASAARPRLHSASAAAAAAAAPWAPRSLPGRRSKGGGSSGGSSWRRRRSPSAGLGGGVSPRAQVDWWTSEGWAEMERSKGQWTEGSGGGPACLGWGSRRRRSERWAPCQATPRMLCGGAQAARGGGGAEDCSAGCACASEFA